MKKILKQFFTFTSFFVIGVGVLPPVIAHADTGDAINDILEGEQNQRNAQKHRDELKHTFNDVLTHTTPLSRD